MNVRDIKEKENKDPPLEGEGVGVSEQRASISTVRLMDEVRAKSAEAEYGLYLGVGSTGFIWAPRQSSVLLLGPPRSGKTSSIVIPAIASANGPVVSTSTKPDVLQATCTARSQVGTCFLYDPFAEHSPKISKRSTNYTELRWSPVNACAEFDAALSISKAMVRAARPDIVSAGDDHWTSRAHVLLAGLLHAAALGHLPLKAVLYWANRHNPGDAFKILEDRNADIALWTLEGIVLTDEREQSGIWSTTCEVLSAYLSEPALASTHEPNFDPLSFADSADTVYICSEGHRQQLLAPLVIGLIDEVVRAKYRTSASQLIDQEITASPPLVLALDELANIAPLPYLPNLVSEGGGQGVLTLACFQDLSQARQRWPVLADGFFSLFGTKLILGGIGDLRTLEAISALLGNRNVPTPTISSPRWWPPNRTSVVGSKSWSIRKERRMDIYDLAKGLPGMALMIKGSTNASWVKLSPWYCSEPWSSLLNSTSPLAGKE